MTHVFLRHAGSHMLPSYYSMRRPFISDADFCTSTKQFPSDVYSSTQPSSMSSYSSLIDSYYPETFGDYRSAATFSSSGSSFLPSSTISSLLPTFNGDSPHLFLRDSWDQSGPEPVSQVEGLCPDSLGSVSVPPSIASPEPSGSPSHYRSPSRGSSMGPVSSSQPYTLHSLEDVHYHPLTSGGTYSVPSSFPCPPYMSSPVSDLVSKMVSEDMAEGHSSLPAGTEAHSSWAKEDGVSPWSPYELRRAY
uniref:Chromosome LG13 open reading frame, human C11orf53 n=1 Tax=Poecilia reticulata TaxID=8081 RepID=A0A3P9PPN0_POERE